MGNRGRHKRRPRGGTKKNGHGVVGLAFKVSAEDHAAFKAASAAAGVPLTTWLRHALRRTAGLTTLGQEE